MGVGFEGELTSPVLEGHQFEFTDPPNETSPTRVKCKGCGWEDASYLGIVHAKIKATRHLADETERYLKEVRAKNVDH